MSVLEQLEWYSSRYASVFGGNDLPIRPRRGVVILTCMDARIQPERFLGLAPGDAQVIRNAGGRVTEDVIRSIAISLECFGANQVVVIHHTDCRMPLIGSDDLLPSPHGPVWGNERTAEEPDRHPLESILKHDLEALRRSPFIDPGVGVFGAIYDVRTGHLQRSEATLTGQEAAA